MRWPWNKEPAPEKRNLDLVSLEDFTEEEIETHMQKLRYGSFELTGAVFPHPRFAPVEGYKKDVYDGEGTSVPVLICSVTKSKILDLFHALVIELGEMVDVVLETSHHAENRCMPRAHIDLHRGDIDSAVLRSVMQDFDEVLLEDGCTGMAVFNAENEIEVQLDEHKQIITHAHDLTAFESVVRSFGIRYNQQMSLIVQNEHMHCSSSNLFNRFVDLQRELGIDEYGFGGDDDGPAPDYEVFA